MTDDKRASDRHRTLKGAKIVYGGGAFTVDCTVRNLSPTGARLLVPTSVAIPDTFMLLEGGRSRPVSVVWRKDDLIGVRFASTDQ
jgi:hypothetical protein